MARKALILAIALIVGQTAFASAVSTVETIRSTPQDSIKLKAGPLQPGIYTVDVDTEVTPRALITQGHAEENNLDLSFTIKKDQRFSISFKDDVVYLSVVIPGQDIGNSPETFGFLNEDLVDLPMKFVMAGNRKTLYANFSDALDTLVAGDCKALVEAHLHFYVKGDCSTDVSDQALANQGFQRSDCGSAQLKLWNGGHSTKHHRGLCGHMAYKTSGGGWSSTDFQGDPGSRYSERGCYARTGGSTYTSNETWVSKAKRSKRSHSSRHHRR